MRLHVMVMRWSAEASEMQRSWGILAGRHVVHVACIELVLRDGERLTAFGTRRNVGDRRAHSKKEHGSGQQRRNAAVS